MKNSWQIGRVAALSCAVALTAGQAWAQYPERAVRLVVPYAAGGSTDSTARLVAKGLSDRLGQPFVVENRSGAGGTIGQALVAKAAPDGYTLLFSAAGPLTVTPHAYSNVPYDPLEAFTPVSLVAQAPLVLLANPRTGFGNVADLVGAARQRPGRITYASFGVGSAAHLAGELFKSIEQVDMTHVPYKGSAPGLTDLIGGQVDVMFDVLVTALPHVQAGTLVPLAITLGQRTSLMPDVPTMQEAGVAGFEAGTWFGLLGPAGLSGDVVARLSEAMAGLLAEPAFREAISAQGAEVAGGSPADFDTFFRSEHAKWGRVARAAGIKAE